MRKPGKELKTVHCDAKLRFCFSDPLMLYLDWNKTWLRLICGKGIGGQLIWAWSDFFLPFFSFAFIAFWAFMYLLCSAIFKSLSVVKRNTKLSHPNNYSELCWRCNLHQACETAGKGGKARVSQGMFWFGIVADWLVREQYRTFSSQLDVSRAVLNWVWKGIRHLLRFCFYYDLRLAK